MDGYETTKIIKTSSTNKQTKIVALTATAFEEERGKILAVGCDDFVRKPFKEEEIFDKMAEQLGIKYLYVEESAERPTEPNFDLPSLTLMPADWIHSLRLAAIAVNAEEIMRLIAEIPNERSELAKALKELVNSYCFDEIINLTEATGN